MTAEGGKRHLPDLLSHALADLPPGPIGIAVSGGGDSMALLDLVHQVLTPLGFAASAATVDHALRPESADEARVVGDFCAGRGIPHHILIWADGRSAARAGGNLMDKARQARLGLLAEWASARGIGTVLLGHTMDDQAEGFVMNLSRAAGIDGLAGMRPRFSAQGIDWRRPLLAAGRAELRDHLRGRAIPWIEDPSNDNDRFARVRARKAMAAMARTGITPGGIAASVAHLQTARAALLAAAAQAARDLTRTEGAALVIAPAALSLPPETLRRLIQSTILWMAEGEYPPRGSQLDRLIAALHQGRPAQLGGLRFLTRNGEVWVAPEMRALAENPAGFAARWRLSPPPAGLIWQAIGASGLQQRPDWRRSGLPRIALEPAPALWRDGQMVAAPALDGAAKPAPTTEIRAEIAQSLADCIGLH